MSFRVFAAGSLAVLGSFLSAATAPAQQPGLPGPAPKELQGRSTNIVLRLTDARVPSINNQVIQWARLDAELGAIFDQRPEKVLFIATSPRDRVEDLRRIVAAARRHGIRVYAQLGPDR